MSSLIRRSSTETSTRTRKALSDLRQALQDEFPGSSGVQVTFDRIDESYYTRVTLDATRPKQPALKVVPEPKDPSSPTGRFFCTCGHPGIGCYCR